MNPSLPPLLANLNAVINNPPVALYIEATTNIKDVSEATKLSLKPFTTLAELTGIPLDALPSDSELGLGDYTLLADVFDRLLDALRIVIVDLPDDYPEDKLVGLILAHWNTQIQYHLGIGYEIEFCTRNNETCPYGESCLICGPNAVNPIEFFTPGFGGFFRDDGTQVDPMTIPIPNLCLNCVNYLTDDWEENILCTLSRMDHKENQEFICYEFRPGNNF